MRFLVTGATGFLGWRALGLIEQSEHDVVALARPGSRSRAHSGDLEPVRMDAGDPAARDLLADFEAVIHCAGVPNPATASADPTLAVRENAGTTLNLLEGCREHGVGLIYPSSVRAAITPPPDSYALSKRLGEIACEQSTARATVVRLPSVFGPGQVAWEGATGAIAAFAARALEGQPIVIPGDPARTRDFLYVDDAIRAMLTIALEGLWDRTYTLATGVATPLIRAAELVRSAADSDSPIEAPGGDLPSAENQSYEASAEVAGLGFAPRPLEDGIHAYVDWLRRHPAAQSRARA